MREAVTAYVALGANLGNAAQTISDAIVCVGQLRGTSITRGSSLYRTAPIDASGPDYINAVIEIHTCLSAPELLAGLLEIERAAGRERPHRHAPRTLDLDILLFGGARIESRSLTVPHPRMNERAFVLVPLAEIAPGWVSAVQLKAVSGQEVQRLHQNHSTSPDC